MDPKQFEEARPIKWGGLKVIGLVSLAILPPIVLKHGPHPGESFVWQDMVSLVLGSVSFVQLLVAGLLKDYWKRNVRGYFVEYKLNNAQLISQVLSRSKRNGGWGGLVIQLPLGGWFAKARIVDWSQGYTWDRFVPIGIRVRNFFYNEEPTVTLTDRRGSTMVDVEVSMVLVILGHAEPIRNLDLSALVMCLLRNEAKFTNLLGGVTDVLTSMNSTNRLIESIEGRQIQAMLARKAADSLDDRDPRKAQFVSIAEHPIPSPKEGPKKRRA